MANIIDVKKEVVKFLKENIACYDVTIIKIENLDSIWNVVAEVYEDDSFLRSMCLPSKKIRLFYLFKINNDLIITAFTRLNSFEGDNEKE